MSVVLFLRGSGLESGELREHALGAGQQLRGALVRAVAAHGAEAAVDTVLLVRSAREQTLGQEPGGDAEPAPRLGLEPLVEVVPERSLGRAGGPDEGVRGPDTPGD